MNRTGAWAGLLLLGLVSACAAQLVRPTSLHGSWAAERWPGTTLAELERGRELYVRRCGGCHALQLPARRPDLDWERSVREMTARSRTPIAPEEADAITRFLVTVAGAAREAEADSSSSTSAAALP